MTYRLVVELNSNFPHPFSDIRSGKTNFKANFVKKEEYDKKHMWPCEKLYEYMMTNFSGRLEKEKKNVYKSI